MVLHLFAKAMELAGTKDDPAAIREKIKRCLQTTF
jgi:hypothetical protein